MNTVLILNTGAVPGGLSFPRPAPGADFRSFARGKNLSAKLFRTCVTEEGLPPAFLAWMNYSTKISKKKEANRMIGLFLLSMASPGGFEPPSPP